MMGTGASLAVSAVSDAKEMVRTPSTGAPRGPLAFAHHTIV